MLAGAPMEISEDLITTFNISLVVRGTVSETSADRSDKTSAELRYKAPKANNMFRYNKSAWPVIVMCHTFLGAMIQCINCNTSVAVWPTVPDRAHLTVCTSCLLFAECT